MPLPDPTTALSTRQEACCRNRDGLNRLERPAPFNPPGNTDFAPDHDIS